MSQSSRTYTGAGELYNKKLTISSSESLDKCKEDGVFLIQSGIHPLFGSGGILIVHTVSEYSCQFVLSLATEAMFVRNSLYSGDWHNWAKVALTNIPT